MMKNLIVCSLFFFALTVIAQLQPYQDQEIVVVVDDVEDFSKILSNDTDVLSIEVEELASDVDSLTGQVAAGSCGCSHGRVGLPPNAESALTAILVDLALDAHKDLSSRFASGVVPPFIVDTMSHVSSVSFQTPNYLIKTQDAVVARVSWGYVLINQTDEHNDGCLLIMLRTDTSNLVTQFRAVHENEKFLDRIPKAKPANVHDLLRNFLNGIHTINQRDSSAHLHEDFVLTFRGQTSLLPAKFENVVNSGSFNKFQEDFSEIFGSPCKSLSCALENEDETTAVLSCILESKYEKVKICLDLIIAAETAENGLLKTVDIYVEGKCPTVENDQHCKTKTELSEAQRLQEVAKLKEAERQRKEVEKAEALKRLEEEKIRKEAERIVREAEKAAEKAAKAKNEEEHGKKKSKKGKTA